MAPLVWLGLAIAGFVAGYLVGWPAWEAYRSREDRDENTERYLAWRGRADRSRPSTREGMTAEERRRIVIGAALAIAGALALLTFFATS